MASHNQANADNLAIVPCTTTNLAIVPYEVIIVFRLCMYVCMSIFYMCFNFLSELFISNPSPCSILSRLSPRIYWRPGLCPMLFLVMW